MRVWVAEEMLHVRLADGRIVATPLDWYPKLREATPEQLKNVELYQTGLHWPELDEDLSIAGMLRGVRPPHVRLSPTSTT